jgi:hypothetical protein
MAIQTGLEKGEERRQRLIEMLRVEPDEVACQRCLSQLDEYVTAQLSGEDVRTRFPAVALHLDACTECAGAFYRLYEVAAAEAMDLLPEPLRGIKPNLSFLASKRHNSPAPTLAERLRSALRRTANGLSLQLSADLVALLRPQPAAGAARTPADGERYEEVLLVLEPEDVLRPDLPLTLLAYRDAQRPAECLVEVVVEQPARPWPALAGIKVALTAEASRHATTTDAWGVAAFEGIPVASLAHLLVEVML